MPIIFSVVANKDTILAKHASCDGNFTEIVEQILSKITMRDNKMTYYHGKYLFHYIVENRHMYFCVTDKTCQRSRAFLFLNEINRQFRAGNKHFSQVLEAEMYRYSDDYSTITIRKGEIDELNRIGVGSSESILGEKILILNEDDNIRFGSIRYINKSPEKIEKFSISINSFALYVIAFVILLFLVLTLYGLGPTSSVGIIIVFSIVFIRRKVAAQ